MWYHLPFASIFPTFRLQVLSTSSSWFYSLYSTSHAHADEGSVPVQHQQPLASLSSSSSSSLNNSHYHHRSKRTLLSRPLIFLLGILGLSFFLLRGTFSALEEEEEKTIQKKRKKEAEEEQQSSSSYTLSVLAHSSASGSTSVRSASSFSSSGKARSSSFRQSSSSSSSSSASSSSPLDTSPPPLPDSIADPSAKTIQLRDPIMSRAQIRSLIKEVFDIAAVDADPTTTTAAGTAASNASTSTTTKLVVPRQYFNSLVRLYYEVAREEESSFASAIITDEIGIREEGNNLNRNSATAAAASSSSASSASLSSSSLSATPTYHAVETKLRHRLQSTAKFIRQARNRARDFPPPNPTTSTTKHEYKTVLSTTLATTAGGSASEAWQKLVPMSQPVTAAITSTSSSDSNTHSGIWDSQTLTPSISGMRISAEKLDSRSKWHIQCRQISRGEELFVNFAANLPEAETSSTATISSSSSTPTSMLPSAPRFLQLKKVAFTVHETFKHLWTARRLPQVDAGYHAGPWIEDYFYYTFGQPVRRTMSLVEWHYQARYLNGKGMRVISCTTPLSSSSSSSPTSTSAETLREKEDVEQLSPDLRRIYDAAYRALEAVETLHLPYPTAQLQAAINSGMPTLVVEEFFDFDFFYPYVPLFIPWERLAWAKVSAGLVVDDPIVPNGRSSSWNSNEEETQQQHPLIRETERALLTLLRSFESDSNNNNNNNNDIENSIQYITLVQRAKGMEIDEPDIQWLVDRTVILNAGGGGGDIPIPLLAKERRLLLQESKQESHGDELNEASLFLKANQHMAVLGMDLDDDDGEEDDDEKIQQIDDTTAAAAAPNEVVLPNHESKDITSSSSSSSKHIATVPPFGHHKWWVSFFGHISTSVVRSEVTNAAISHPFLDLYSASSFLSAQSSSKGSNNRNIEEEEDAGDPALPATPLLPKKSKRRKRHQREQEGTKFVTAYYPPTPTKGLISNANKEEERNLLVDAVDPLWVSDMTESLLQLAPRGTNPTSFRLYEALQMGLTPVYVWDGLRPWLPYQDPTPLATTKRKEGKQPAGPAGDLNLPEVDHLGGLWDRIAFIVHVNEFDGFLDALPILASESAWYESTRAAIAEARDAYFTYDAVIRHIYRLLLDPTKADLQCSGPIR